MKRLIISMFFAFVIVCKAHAQPITIGEKVPDIVFNDVYNHHADTLRLADYRGKWVILDFWNTYCISCLKSFPKLDSLQREYNDEVQVIAVSSTNRQETETFFDTHENVFRPDIPFITGDTLLAELFPHSGDPYLVWVNPQGKVIHLTAGYFLTRERLDLALAEGNARIPTRAKRTRYYETPIDTTLVEEVAYTSTLMHVNFHKGYRIEKRRAPNEYTEWGTVKSLYQKLFQQFDAIAFNARQPNRTQIIAAHPELYDVPKSLKGEKYVDWMNRHAFFYQARTPLADSSRLFDWINADFERYFGLKATVELKIVDTWVLSFDGAENPIKTSGGSQEHSFFAQNPRHPTLDSVRRLVNLPYSHFSSYITRMVERLTNMPCFDETGFSGNIDISFKGSSLDAPSMKKLQAELKNYGMSLRREHKRLAVLVLREQEIRKKVFR